MVEGGIGLYVVNFEDKGFDPVAGSFSGKDNDTVIGGHLVAGANIDITRKVFWEWKENIFSQLKLNF